MDDESSEYWLVILRFWPALFDGVVASYYDSDRSDASGGAFDLGREFPLVCPVFDVRCSNCIGCHLFDDDCLLIGVTIPPDVATLEICVWPLVTYVVRFT